MSIIKSVGKNEVMHQLKKVRKLTFCCDCFDGEKISSSNRLFHFMVVKPRLNMSAFICADNHYHTCYGQTQLIFYFFYLLFL